MSASWCRSQSCGTAFTPHELTPEGCVVRGSERPAEEAWGSHSAVFRPSATSTDRLALYRCSSIPGPSGQRTATRGLALPGSLRLPPRDNRGHCSSVVGFRQQESFVWRGLWPVHPTQIDSGSRSLSQILWVVSTPLPLTFSGISASYFNISASLERTRAAPRGHVHCAVSSACLVLAHSPGAPVLVLSSLARKCAGVWTLFSRWYLTSGLPRALPSLPSRGLCFPALPPAPAHGFAFQEAEAPPTSPWAVHTVFCCRRSS